MWVVRSVEALSYVSRFPSSLYFSDPFINSHSHTCLIPSFMKLVWSCACWPDCFLLRKIVGAHTQLSLLGYGNYYPIICFLSASVLLTPVFCSCFFPIRFVIGDMCLHFVFLDTLVGACRVLINHADSAMFSLQSQSVIAKGLAS